MPTVLLFKLSTLRGAYHLEVSCVATFLQMFIFYSSPRTFRGFLLFKGLIYVQSYKHRFQRYQGLDQVHWLKNF